MHSASSLFLSLSTATRADRDGGSRRSSSGAAASSARSPGRASGSPDSRNALMSQSSRSSRNGVADRVLPDDIPTAIRRALNTPTRDVSRAQASEPSKWRSTPHPRVKHSNQLDAFASERDILRLTKCFDDERMADNRELESHQRQTDVAWPTRPNQAARVGYSRSCAASVPNPAHDSIDFRQDWLKQKEPKRKGTALFSYCRDFSKNRCGQPLSASKIALFRSPNHASFAPRRTSKISGAGMSRARAELLHER